MRPDDADGQAQQVNRSELAGPADVVQARDVHGGVHFHSSDAGSDGPTPRQLPGDVRGFVNRSGELAFLDTLLADQPEPSAVTLVVLAGTAGVGKTSLALRWAHSVRDRFPDGQLYVNLKGYDAGPPAEPAPVLDRFLRALGTPAGAVPADLEDRAALYRSRLADRRMLVVLDNAATVGQVRPLLPGTASCLVLVTTRSRLSGLVARDGGRRLTVGVLPEPDAINLIERTINGYRHGDDPEQVRELAALCARLPIALRIAAERAASRPFMPMSELIQDLRDESALWDALSAEDNDEADAVRTVFAWSYRALPDDAARLFRLLGLHPGADFSVSAAAALLGTSAHIHRLLDLLVGASLLEQRSPGRYQLHDLLRAYAIDQTRLLETADQRGAALHRILDWYLRTADAAVAAAFPQQAGPSSSFATAAEAIAWFELERDNLVAATRAAASAEFHDTTCRLATALRSFFMHLNAFEDWIATARLGLAAARAAGNDHAEAEALESLGKVHFQARRLDEATEHHTAALRLRQAIGDRFGEAVSVNALGLLALRRRDLDTALEHFSSSLRIVRELGNRRWEALLLANLGEATFELGRLAEARDLLDAALAAQRELGDAAMVGNSLFFLSMTLRELALIDDARDAINAATRIAEEYTNPVWLAHWLVESARVSRAAGQPGGALAPLREAVAIQRRLGDRSREATALDGTGEAYRELGQPAEAVKFHLHAAAIHGELADRWQQAIALDNLATALAANSRPDDARQRWIEASALLTTFTDPRATAMRERIAARLS